ncbi:hypothetical protein TRFO_24212 [Tritrichomonas foetus]|uniref:BEACH-type PH domain-containing protein n=1 Tax=Tritrichomonas foetus TaxID=1144522 RepID=A0A1J4K7W1_9EUKA|nr:hypothetical protein TRFO_24212 [Tritrichomonas foetus]|eukprot:OHT07487.1 hypothetical protein TRFO_24212 [Tritrichomonas foetus]
MKKSALLTQGEVFMQVLRLPSNIDKPTIRENDAAQQFFSKIKFPSFSQEEFRTIEEFATKEIQKGNYHDFKSTLASHNYSFEFNSGFIDILLSNLTKSNLKFAILFVLNEYIAWTIENEGIQSQKNQLTININSIEENSTINQMHTSSEKISKEENTNSVKNLIGHLDLTQIHNSTGQEIPTDLGKKCEIPIFKENENCNTFGILKCHQSASNELDEQLNEQLVHLLAALAAISDYEVTNVRNVIVSAFTILYKNSIKNKIIENKSRFLSTLYLFLEKNSSNQFSPLPDKCYKMIPMTVEWMIQKNDHTENSCDDNNDILSFLSFVSKIKLPEKYAQKMLNLALYSAFSDNDVISFCFGNYFNQVSINYASALLCQIPVNLYSYIQNRPVINHIPNIPENHIFTHLPKAEAFNASLCFNSEETFRISLDTAQTVNFPPQIELVQMIHPDLISKLNTFVGAAFTQCEHIRTITINFEEVLKAEIHNEHILDLYSLFIFIIKLFPPDKMSEIPYTIFFNNIIFNPKYTIFDNFPGYEVINTLRCNALSILVSINEQNIDNFLSCTMVSPKLFAEILHRFIANHKLLPSSSKSQIKMGRCLINAALFYRSFSSQNIPDVELASTTIFAFIGHLFLDQAYLALFFNDYSFSYSYLSFLYEPLVRQHVLYQLLAYFLKEQKEDNTDVPQNVIGIIDITSTYFPDKRAVCLVSDVLNTINEALMHRRKLIRLFSSLFDILFRAMKHLDDSEQSQQLIDNILLFLVMATKNHLLTEENLQVLENCISKSYKENPSQKIFEKYIQLLSAEYMSSFNPSFFIRQPLVIRSFLSLFSKSDKLSDVINYISDLCNYSTMNSIACSKSEIDLWIINFLKKENEKSPKNKKHIKQALSLLEKIETIISNNKVAQNLISLFVPVESQNYLQENQILILNSLQTMISAAIREPYVFCPFGYPIKITNINVNQVSKTFCFVCWIYHDSSIAQYKPTIFSFIEQPEKCIEFTFHSNQIHIDHQNELYNSSGSFDHRIPSKQWSMLAFRFVNNIETEKESYLFIRINMSKWEKMKFPYMKFKNKSQIEVTIGSLAKDSISPKQQSKIGSFGLFSEIDNNIVDMIYESGPQRSPTSLKNCIFYCQPQLINSEFVYCEFSNDFQCHISQHDKSFELTSPISYVFVQPSGICSLLPLFDLIKEDRRVADSLIGILGHLFQITENCQSSFHELNGFGIISNSLKNFNYQIYASFYNLLDTISYEPLQLDLIDNILINFILLIHSDPESQLRIIKHWGRIIFPSFTAQMTSVRSLSYFLKAFSRFYHNFASNDCRLALLSLCNNMPFNPDEFKEFTTELLISNDSTKDLLEFLYQQIDINTSHFNFELNLDPLFNLMQLSNDRITYLLVKILVQSHRKHLITNISLNEHINVLLDYFYVRYTSQELYELFLNELERNKEILPICCCLATYYDSTLLIKNLRPSKEYSTHCAWSLWPLYLAQYLKIKDQQYFLLQFVIMSDSFGLKNVFEMINFVGNQNEACVDELKAMFFQILYPTLDSIELSEIFLSIAQRYLFLRTTTPNYLLFNQMSRSPFSKSVIDIIRCNFTKPINFINPDNFRLSHYTNQQSQKCFCIRHENNIWRDLELAKNCLNLIIEGNFKQFIHFDLIICSYLIKYDFYFVKNHLEQLKLSNDEIAENLPIIQYIQTRVNKSIDLFGVNVAYNNDTMVESLNKYQEIIENWTNQENQNLTDEMIAIIQYHDNLVLKRKDGKLPKFSIKTDFIGRIMKKEKSLYDERKRLFKSLTVKYAPWFCESNYKFKRENLICSPNYCMPKVTRICKIEKNMQYFSFPMKIMFSSECEIIKPMETIHTTFILEEEEGYILNKRFHKYSWLKWVLPRKINDKNNAIEFFFKSGKTQLINFPNQSSDQILKMFRRLAPKALIQIEKPMSFFKKLGLTEKWQHREITTLTYISLMNIFSGRSYNDIDKYPMIPWIFANINNSNKILRNFRETEVGKISRSDVALLISKMKPFKSYNQISLELNDSLVEMTPEFFSIPEIFGNATLPQWCNRNPYELVCMMNKSLENEFVSKHIVHWFNIVWKYKKKKNVNIQRRKTSSNLNIVVKDTTISQETARSKESLNDLTEIDDDSSNNDKISSTINTSSININSPGYPKNNSAKISKSRSLDINSINNFSILLGSNSLPDTNGSAIVNETKNNSILTEAISNEGEKETEDDQNERIKNRKSDSFEIERNFEYLFSHDHPPRYPKLSKELILNHQINIQTIRDKKIIFAKIIYLSQLNYSLILVDSNGHVFISSTNFSRVSKGSINISPAAKIAFLQPFRELQRSQSSSFTLHDTNISFLALSHIARQCTIIKNFDLNNISHFRGNSFTVRGENEIFVANGQKFDVYDLILHSHETSNHSQTNNLNSNQSNPSPPQSPIRQSQSKASFSNKIRKSSSAIYTNMKEKQENVLCKYKKCPKNHNIKAVCVSSDESNVIIGCENSIIYVNKKPIPLFCGKPTCCAINADYQLAVCGTDQNCIAIISINKMATEIVTNINGDNNFDSNTNTNNSHSTNNNINRSLDSNANYDVSNDEIMAVLITKRWGFIVAKTKKELILLNVNGNIIKRQEAKESISTWTTWSSCDGTDYVAYVTDSGRIILFEALYLDLNELPFKALNAVAIEFVPNDNGLVFVYENGTATFTPFIHE